MERIHDKFKLIYKVEDFNNSQPLNIYNDTDGNIYAIYSQPDINFQLVLCPDIYYNNKTGKVFTILNGEKVVLENEGTFFAQYILARINGLPLLRTAKTFDEALAWLKSHLDQ
jgi:hypothetical protein